MAGLLSAIIVGLAVIGGLVGGLIYKGKQDNPIEEVAEMVIEVVTGEDIDLTPTSKEK